MAVPAYDFLHMSGAPVSPYRAVQTRGSDGNSLVREQQLVRRWYAHNLGEIGFCGKFVLYCIPKDDLANTGGTFSGLNLGRDASNIF